MAKATLKEKTKKVVVLSMTQLEADVLRTAIGNISGGSKYSYGDPLYDVWEALCDVSTWKKGFPLLVPGELQ